VLHERDSEMRTFEVRQNRQANTRQDSQLLMSSWRAIARSHRLLDQGIYRLQGGELHAILNPPDERLQFAMGRRTS
jgi:hypothetical protein